MDVSAALRRVRRPLRWLGLALLALVVVIAADLGFILLTTPDPTALAATNPVVTSYMRYRASTATPTRAPEPVRWVPLEWVAPVATCAVVKSEDTWFFRHTGIDWPQLAWAAGRLILRAGDVGTSTITQQLARNQYLTPERSVQRKLREAVIATRLERSLSKKRILEIYLNVVEWGDGVWGIEQASRHYLGKGPSELDLFDAAFLVSLLPAPRRDLVAENRVRAYLVQSGVLWELQQAGLVQPPDAQAAYGRVNVLHLALQSGEPVLTALQRRPPVVPPSAALELESVLRTECGLDRALAQGRGAFPARASGVAYELELMPRR